MQLALAMIVKGVPEEAEPLARCLRYAALFVDKVFITITHAPGEDPAQEVIDIAKFYEAEISFFEWVNDFSRARNFNFSQVPKEYEYIFWLDADDAPRGIENIKDIIEKNKSVDAFTMFYLYAFDEYQNPIVVHQKTRIIRNDGCMEWVGKIHEDFKENRTITNFFIKGAEVLHLTDEARIAQSTKRNAEIAREMVKSDPTDPRSYWNLGNALKADGDNEAALEALNEFLKRSNSEDEKYIAHLRKAECLWILGRKQESIEEARLSVGTKPFFPDAYHLLGTLYFETNQFEKAKEMYLMGLSMRPPYYSIVVYNPRDYDYTPLMNLAKTYFNLSLPTLAIECLKSCQKIYPKDKNIKELIAKMQVECDKFDKVSKIVARLLKIKDKKKLEAALKKVPDDMKSHPAICRVRNLNFKKETSSGKDLVFFCGYSWEEWTPETAMKSGIGGSEEAVIHLANKFADMGWNVTVYNNCGHEEQVFGKVTYKPFWSWNYMDKQDVLILWRVPKYLDFDINATKIYLDMHDVIPEGEMTPSRIDKVTKIFVKSQYQRSLWGKIPDEKFVIVPNGIDPAVFDQEIERDPYLVINTSAPNRGIAVLSEMWPKVKAAVPQAKLKWAYGWGVFDEGFQGNAKVAQWKNDIRKRMLLNGVEELGRVSHSEVAKLYMQANIWAYPSGFGEIDCISLSKAMAGGAIPVTTDFAALGEKQGHGGYFFHSDRTDENWKDPFAHDFSIVDPVQIEEMTQKMIELLKNPPSEQDREAMRSHAKSTYSWDGVASKWQEEFLR